jgi:hypothetical protein
MNNCCRNRGVAGSAVDFLIWAAAQQRGWSIFTTDSWFPELCGHTAVAAPRGVPHSLG